MVQWVFRFQCVALGQRAGRSYARWLMPPDGLSLGALSYGLWKAFGECEDGMRPIAR